ncbi:MAG: hypothetical protein AB7O73_01570 [Bacteroidia bacterium]
MESEFDYIGNEFDLDIKAYLVQDSSTSLMFEAIVHRLNSQLIDLKLTAIDSNKKNILKQNMLAARNNNDSYTVVKNQINTFIKNELLNKQNIYYEQSRKKKRNVVMSVIIVIVLILLSALLWIALNNYKRNHELSNEKAEIDSIFNSYKEVQIKDASAEQLPNIVNIPENTDTNITTQFTKPKLIINPNKDVNGFPVEIITIDNTKNNSPILFNSITISILNFDNLLGASEARELSAFAKYKVELYEYKGTYEVALSQPIIIKEKDAGTVEVLFFCKDEGNYFAPYDKGKFSFTISFNSNTIDTGSESLKIEY